MKKYPACQALGLRVLASSHGPSGKAVRHVMTQTFCSPSKMSLSIQVVEGLGCRVLYKKDEHPVIMVVITTPQWQS